MKMFLTSSPFLESNGNMNRANGFRRRLVCASRGCKRGLFVASDPTNHERNVMHLTAFVSMLESGGIVLDCFEILDDQTREQTESLVRSSDFIILSGGHVPTQNAFFEEIGLRDALSGFDGVILAISAGSMNSATTVYAQPEEPGEAVDPLYQRFLTGLGLTDINILPHYQAVKDELLDGLRLYEDIAFSDSMGKHFYVMPDGSYLYRDNRRQTIYGECYLIQDGMMEKMCEKGHRISV